MNVKKPLINILSLAAIGLLLLNTWFYFLQPSMLFYPYKYLTVTPKDWSLAYENVEIVTTDNIRLHGWYLPVSNSRQVVLFFHGNGGNISHREDSLKIFNQLGLNVLIIDYRGYGLSEGSITESGIYLDAMAAWQYLLNQHDYSGKDIIVFGRSLGGAVATQLASQVQPRALIIESSFSSIKDMASRILPFISKLIYLRYDFNTESSIKQVRVPVLVMHSLDDDIIPFQLGIKIFKAANEPKEFYKLQGNHNNGFMESMPEYQQTIKQFLGR
ncbi:Hydrolase, alpha/beta fold family [hydrothermal vent metagenome]|uniref:Hydrolase, alpha/beta fold family n=1 Tax=hydrothermal vent metagenome TaxID=652676 RepID=A0A3B1A475_9ZZZZ